MNRRNDTQTAITSRWEWVAAAISGALVLGTIAVLLGDAAQPGEPPHISVQVDTVLELSSGYLARISVRNHGTETAADLVVEAELSGGPSASETSTITLDYVPGGAVREAGVFFSSDPRAGTLRIRALGFRAP